jgi:hypothetical protein
MTRQGQWKRIHKTIEDRDDPPYFHTPPAKNVNTASSDQSRGTEVIEEYLNPEETFNLAEDSVRFVNSQDAHGVFFSEQHSPESEPEDSCSPVESARLREDLRKWSVKHGVSHVAVSSLLCILRTHKCFNLPRDARTLLHTPRTVEIDDVASGSYAHLGIEYNLRKLLTKLTQVEDTIHLMIGIDGIPLFHSSSKEFWPILASISNIPSLTTIVFPIGIYFGKTKPDDCYSFLKPFVDEAVKLTNDGVAINGKNVRIVIKAIVCDAPAKAYVLGVKHHSGYSSCTRCKQTGLWYQNRITFPKFDAMARSHEGFISKEDEEFHNCDSPLVDIPYINFVKSFPLDYMHLVCLGVVRTLFYIWIFGPVPLKFPHRTVELISSKLRSLSYHMPSEFCRKPRGLDEIKRFKASEYRQILLYSGSVILFEALKVEYGPVYDHFLSLSISMSILLHPQYCHEYLQYAKDLLVHFVKTCINLYGKQYITHNFHGLTHIADDVETFGPLDSCSAFKFENYLQILKRYVRKGDKPLEQVVKRVLEMLNHDCEFSDSFSDAQYPEYSGPHFSGPVLPGCDSSQQYKSVSFSGFKLTTTHPNSICCLRDGSIVVISHIVFSNTVECMIIVCREFLKKEDFFSAPFIESSKLGIYLVSNLSEVHARRVSDISKKIVLLPFRNEHVAFPMLH